MVLIPVHLTHTESIRLNTQGKKLERFPFFDVKIDDFFRLAGNNELAERLVECMYEVTDRLIFYSTGKKTDHKSGKHFIIPEDITPSDPNVVAKLQKVRIVSSKIKTFLFIWSFFSCRRVYLKN